MATQDTYVKEVSDPFGSIATQLANGDILELALGDHPKWSMKFDDISSWGWTVGESYNIIGRRTATVTIGAGTGSLTMNTLGVQIAQPGITVTAEVPVSVTVSTLDVQIVQPSATVSTATNASVSAATLVVEVVQGTAGVTAVITTSVTVTPLTLEIQVVQPAAVPSTEVNVTAGTLSVPVTQPSVVVQIPVGDIVLWYFDGVEWVSFQTQQLVTSFSDTSPYTGDEFAIIGGVTSDASNIGMRMRRSTRWVTMSIQSDEGIGTPPTSSCVVHIFVDGASAASIPFDGTTYGASGVIDVDASAGALVTFKYVNDAGGQSAGKVVVMAEYRWRRA